MKDAPDIGLFSIAACRPVRVFSSYIFLSMQTTQHHTLNSESIDENFVAQVLCLSQTQNEIVLQEDQQILKSYCNLPPSVLLQSKQIISQFLDVFYQLPLPNLEYWFRCRIQPTGLREWSLKIVQKDSDVKEWKESNILQYKELKQPSAIVEYLNMLSKQNKTSIEEFSNVVLAMLPTSRISASHAGFETHFDCVMFSNTEYYQVCTLVHPVSSNEESMRVRVKELQQEPALSPILAYLAWKCGLEAPCRLYESDSLVQSGYSGNWEIERRFLLLQMTQVIRQRALDLGMQFLQHVQDMPHHIYSNGDGQELILEWVIHNQDSRIGSLMVVFEEEDVIWVSLHVEPGVSQEAEFTAQEVSKAAKLTVDILEKF